MIREFLELDEQLSSGRAQFPEVCAASAYDKGNEENGVVTIVSNILRFIGLITKISSLLLCKIDDGLERGS